MAPLEQPNGGLYKADLEDDEDEYAAPTKVGEMSDAAVAKLMSDVDLQPGPASSTRSRASDFRALTPPPSQRAKAEDDGPLPVFGDEGNSEPTKLHDSARLLATDEVAPISEQNLVGSIVEQMEARLQADKKLIDESGVEHRRHLVPAPVLAVDSSAVDLSSLLQDEPPAPQPPPVPAKAAPRPHAFPDWVTWRPEVVEARKDRELMIRLGIASAIFLVIVSLVVWLLF